MRVLEQKIESLVVRLNPGTRIGLAISGGLDSLVLLALLAKSTQVLAGKIRIYALHVCHYIREAHEIQKDQEIISKYCTTWNIPFFVHHLDPSQVKALARVKGLEASARDLRYAAFAAWLERLGLDQIFTAHHADDDMETQIMAFARGASLRALSGIPAERSQFRRPLLECTRAEIEQWAIQNSLVWSEDSTNLDTSIVRNAVRHELIPVLHKIFPGFVTALQRSRTSYAQDDEALSLWASRAWQEIQACCSTADSMQKHRLHIEGSLWQSYPSAIKERLLYRAFEHLGLAKPSHTLIASVHKNEKYTLQTPSFCLKINSDSFVLDSSIVCTPKNSYLLSIDNLPCILDFGIGSYLIFRDEHVAARDGLVFFNVLGDLVFTKLDSKGFEWQLATESAWYKVDFTGLRPRAQLLDGTGKKAGRTICMKSEREN